MFSVIFVQKIFGMLVIKNNVNVTEYIATMENKEMKLEYLITKATHIFRKCVRLLLQQVNKHCFVVF